MSPIQHISDMDTINGDSPALDQFNRIKEIGFTNSVLPKAAAYTLQAEDSGKVIKATAAGPTTFTLPAPAAGNAGWNFKFHCLGAGGMVINFGGALGVGKNLATATTATYTTAGNMIGAACEVVSDGTNWLFFEQSGCTVVLA